MAGSPGPACFACVVFAIALVLLTFNPADDSSAMVWIGLVILGIVLGIGLSWSLVRARTTGQIETQ